MSIVSSVPSFVYSNLVTLNLSKLAGFWQLFYKQTNVLPVTPSIMADFCNKPNNANYNSKSVAMTVATNNANRKAISYAMTVAITYATPIKTPDYGYSFVCLSDAHILTVAKQATHNYSAECPNAFSTLLIITPNKNNFSFYLQFDSYYKLELK